MVIYDAKGIGPALKALREARQLKQADVARALGRSEPNISRVEREGANPQAANLLAYLEAIGADLTDLHRQMTLHDPVNLALEKQVEQGMRRLKSEPGYRRLAKDLLDRFGGDELPRGLSDLAELIDDRFSEIERRLPPGGEQGGPDGFDRGPIES